MVDSSRLKIESAYISSKTVWSVIAPSGVGTVPVIGLYEVKVGKLFEALNTNF